MATAMVRLWEKSMLAKIAIKRGVQSTTSERMAEDLKVIRTLDWLMLKYLLCILVILIGNFMLSS